MPSELDLPAWLHVDMRQCVKMGVEVDMATFRHSRSRTRRRSLAREASKPSVREMRRR